MFKGIVAGVMLAFSGLAAADTTYTLPDPSIAVSPNVNNTTTVTIDGVAYRGPAAFYYLSACPKPNTPRYHCSIIEEDGVVLTAADGSIVTVTIVDQSASSLIISGHNYWRHTDTVLDGSVTTP